MRVWTTPEQLIEGFSAVMTSGLEAGATYYACQQPFAKGLGALTRVSERTGESASADTKRQWCFEGAFGQSD